MMRKSWRGWCTRGSMLLGLLNWLAAPVIAQPAAARGFVPPVEVELPAVMPPELTGWRYVAIPGVEVLALAPDETIRTYVENIARQRANLDAVLPRDLRIDWDRPLQVILYGTENPRPMPGIFVPMLSKVYTERERERAAENREGKPLEVRVEPRIMPGAFVFDADSMCVLNIVQPKVKGSDLSSLPAASYVATLLESRSPPLPAWFVEGVSMLFAQASVTGSDLDFSPFLWVSPAQTQLMLKDRSMPVEILPMTEIFGHVNQATVSSDERRRATVRSQSALFVRWCFEGRGQGGVEALWNFVRSVRPGADSEMLFKESFGMSTTAVADALRNYLSVAIRKPARVRLNREGRPPAIEIRAATPSEVARIRGEWDRLSGRLVGASHPVLRSFYDETARRVLASGPDNATADHELLASRGLMAVETGDDAAALPLLEAACAAPQPRPRAVVELSRIRLAQARAVLEPGARLEASVVAAIIQPLRAVLGSRPPMPRAYQIMAEAWSVSAVPPTPADLELLADGVRTMPGDASLVIAAARLLVELGRVDEARAAIESGLAHVGDDGSRRRLYALRSAVRAAAPKAP